MEKDLAKIKVVVGGTSHVLRNKVFCQESGLDALTFGLSESVSVSWVGKGGLKVQTCIDVPGAYDGFLKKVQCEKADIAIFIDGGNDLDRDTSHYLSDKEHAAEIACAMIVLARHAAPTAKVIYIMSIVPRLKTRYISVERFGMKAHECNLTLKNLLDPELAQNLAVSPISFDFTGINYWNLKGLSNAHIDDKVHLNPIGQRKLFHEIKKAISISLEDSAVWNIPRLV